MIWTPAPVISYSMTKHPEIQLLQITVTLITNLQLDSALLGGIWDLGLSKGRSLTSSS